MRYWFLLNVRTTTTTTTRTATTTLHTECKQPKRILARNMAVEPMSSVFVIFLMCVRMCCVIVNWIRLTWINSYPFQLRLCIKEWMYSRLDSHTCHAQSVEHFSTQYMVHSYFVVRFQFVVSFIITLIRLSDCLTICCAYCHLFAFNESIKYFVAIPVSPM